MIGAIIGDIAGSVYEFNSVEIIDFEKVRYVVDMVVNAVIDFKV